MSSVTLENRLLKYILPGPIIISELCSKHAALRLSRSASWIPPGGSRGRTVNDLKLVLGPGRNFRFRPITSHFRFRTLGVWVADGRMDGLVAQCSARLLQQVCPLGGARGSHPAAAGPAQQRLPQAAAASPAPDLGACEAHASRAAVFSWLGEENPIPGRVVRLSH